MIQHSDSIVNLSKALIVARGQFDPILKDATNPHWHSKYATLSAVIGATQKQLGDNGLLVIQSPLSQESQAGVDTLLCHTSGEFLLGTFTVPIGARADAQSACGATTYARRYAYLGILGLAAEDNDGNQTSPADPAPQRGRPRTVSSAPAREGTSGIRSQSGQRPPRALDKALHTPPDAIGDDSSHFQAQNADLPPEMFMPSETENTVNTTELLASPTESDTSVVFEHGKLTEPYLTRAKEMLNTLTSIGLAASDKLSVGAKLKTYILTHSGAAIPQENLTAKEFNAAFRDLDILLRDEGTKKLAVTLVDSKNDISKKGKK